MSQQSPNRAARSTAGPFELQGLALPPSPSPSLTYEPHYGLKEKAFSLSADPRFLYRSPAHAPAFEELLTGIRRREGLIVLTGEIGTGKTTLIRSVLQHLDRRTFTAFVPDPFVSREDLLKMLLVDFGVVSLADLKRGGLAGASRPDLSYPLYEFLDSLVPLQAFAVVIIDEAQNLPLTLLEEIRILSDLEQREKLLQVVLVGQPELKAHLKMREMRQVDQRVSVRCELCALNLSEVGKYVRHRLAVASENGNHVQFSDGAIDTLFKASGGVPRVINLLCDRAMQHGHRHRATLIESALIQAAATSLGIEGRARAALAVRTDTRADVTPAPVAEPVKATAVPVKAPAGSPQILSELAAEADLAGPSSSPRLWRIAAALVLVAVVVAAIVTIWLLSLTTQSVGVGAATLPARPKWTSEDLAIPPPVRFAGASGPSATPVAVHDASDGSLAIQVASLTSRVRADRLVAELSQAGLRAHIVEFDLGPPRGVVLHVRADGYTTAAEAERDLGRIRQLPGFAGAHLLSNQGPSALDASP